jgi:GT2 family glycosyltransferase
MTVVDNSPNDALRSVCSRLGVEYERMTGNIGFGAGHNYGIRNYEGRSKYHVMLNPDIYFGPGTLEALFKVMEANTQVGWVMPLILYPDRSLQQLCRRVPSPFDLFVRRFTPSFVKRALSGRLDYYECDDIDLSQPCIVPHLSGCFILARTQALIEVGGFDERFFLYMEDTDLCRRMAERYQTLFYPSATVFHERAQGSYRNSSLLWLHVVSAVNYFNKWGWFGDTIRKRLNREARPIVLQGKT